MRKDLKTKHSISSRPYKVWGNFFRKKALHGETNSFGQIYGRMFYLGYWYIIWKVNTTIRGLNLKHTFCTLCLWGWGFHVKPFFVKKNLKWWPILWCIDYRALLDLCIYGPDSWISELRGYIQSRKGLGSDPGSWWPWDQISIKHSD